MRLDTISYGPHSRVLNYDFYFYNEEYLQYGYTLNDANDSIGFGIQFQQTGTVSGIGFYAVEYQGNPDYIFSFVTVSGNPIAVDDPEPQIDPDTKIGTLFSNSEWQTYEPEVVGSGWNWIDLATPLDVTKGEYAALVVIPSGAVTPDGSNYVEINDESTFRNSWAGNWRYATSWFYDEWVSPMSIRYSDTTLQGWSLTGLPWGQFSSPEEWGVEFQLPVQATCVGGIFNLYPVDSPGPNAPFKLILTNAGDTELASVTIVDYDLVSSYNNYNITLGWDTATDPVLEANTTYRMYLKPTSADPLDKKGFILENEAAKVGLPGGTNWKWIERSTPASGWTYKTDHYPWMSVAIIDLQSGGGAGGGGEGGAAFGFVG